MSDADQISGEAPLKPGILGRLGRGSAIAIVLGVGVLAAGAILSYERKMPASDDHGHGGAAEKAGEAGHSHAEGKEGEAGHSHTEGKAGEAGHSHAEGKEGVAGHSHAEGKAGEAGHSHAEGKAGEAGHSHAEGKAGEAGHSHAEGKEGEAGHSHAEGKDGHDDKPIKLTPQQRDNAKLTIDAAQAGTIRQTLVLNGIIQPNEEKTVAVLPRFGGVVRAMGKRLGDKVKKGEIVARIESNESLTQYEIQAPMDGVVIERNGVLGEYAGTDKRLMVISDLSEVWVDLRVYSQDFSKLKLGQKVDIDLPGHDEPHSATISYLSPIGMTDTQSMLARAAVQNSDGGFLPGLFVTGRVLVSEQAAAVSVKQTAVQYIDGKAVMFVEDDHGFEKREVELGAKDDTMIEVLSGLQPGDKVVTGNSFILKAELGKGEAEHVH